MPDTRPLGEPLTHYWLVKSMADSCGADVVAAFDAGEISSGEWAELVTNCRGCTQPGTCRRMLDRMAFIPEPPDYCENRDRLTELAHRPD